MARGSPDKVYVVTEHWDIGMMPVMMGADAEAAEQSINFWLKQLIGYQHTPKTFHWLSAGGFYLAPVVGDEPLKVICGGPYHNQEISSAAAGIIATLFMLTRFMSQGAIQYQRYFDRLSAHASGINDSRMILDALNRK